ncbi:phospholipase A2 [Amycolatopsis sp. CA-230715]|uniref:phospholipase A2 n=1 Tax=Amycolatopsis sp. CA-230715 TaxID=2745196 RepID=UPI001C01408B|nr:phospholipase A2 [Amycolatopsis sp. CA-230715]QWF84933.1 hypothetical protein HUW46_08385 [Amycolatopsis sp. CA-230715]
MFKLRIMGGAVGAVALLALGAGTASADGAEGATPAAATQVAAHGESAPRPVRVYGDGCTRVPDSFGWANFRPACDKHDKCYGKSSHTSRKNCDRALLGNLRKACAKAYSSWNPLRYNCFDVSNVYYVGVRNFGRSHYQGKGDPA